MFRAAMVLAEHYKIYVHNQPINYTILETIHDGDGFATLELLCKSMSEKTESDIVGIVGPTSSVDARFLAPFAARIQMPLISYSATNADLHDRFTYETFYRIVPSDVLVAKAITQILKYFSWTTCIMILGKTDYGYGGLKIMSEVYYSELSIVERLIFDPRLDKFQVDLQETLEKSRSRIILVWANEISSTRIIQLALAAGLLGGPYVWIMTNTININSFKLDDWPKLEGILAVLPFIGNRNAFGVNETLQKEAFNIWHNSLTDKGSFPQDIVDVSPFAMYTFDATWILLQALNKSSFDKRLPSMEESTHCFNSLLQNYSQYHMYLKNTYFLGVSGIVQFSKNNTNDRINGSFYALYNIQYKAQQNSIGKRKPRYKHILTWHETSYNWMIGADDETHNIIWPGNQFEGVPTDYPQLRGQHLRILVIEAPPFVIAHNTSISGQLLGNPKNSKEVSFPSSPLKTKNPNIVIYGFIVDFIRDLAAQMHFNYSIDLANLTVDYHSLVASLEKDDRQYDIVLSDIRITSSRFRTVDFSTPFHENTLRIIIRKNSYSSSFSLFSAFNPFTWDVWLVILGVIIYSSSIIYLFEYQNIMTDQNDECGIKSVFMGICQVFGSVIIMNGNIKLTTNASRLTLLGLYGLYIILVAIYTANLSSFLTLNRVQPAISGIDDIKNNRFHFSRIGIVTNSAVTDYYIRNISSIYYPLSSAEEIYLRLLDYTIDAAIWDSSILEYAANNYFCDKLSVVGAGFMKSSYGIVFPKGWLYKKDFDVHITSMRETETLEILENRWLGRQTCSLLSDKKENDGIFSLYVMGGLFLMFMILTIIAFILHIWHSRKYFSRKNASGLHAKRIELDASPVKHLSHPNTSF